MHPAASLQQLVEKEIAAWNPGSYPNSLYEPARYMLSPGGKRLRPVLVLMGCELAGGDVSTALPLALGVEVFHNFTLLHDDIMDNAPLRRGHPTVHQQWNIPTAILAGDVLFVKSIQLIHSCGHPQVMEIFLHHALLVCEGQQLDMDFEKRQDVSIKEYLEMITLKTAVLTGACLQAGALVAGAPQQTAHLLYEAGKNMGIAFQLNDDLLDVYSDERFGKQTGGDILAGKKTYLYLRALELLDNQQAQQLRIIYSSKKNDPAVVPAVRALFDSVNIAAEARKLMDEYYQQAMQYLQNVPVDEYRKQPLKGLFEQLMNRHH
jgi:geranylgeranyl diphosphate synthase type II